MPTGLASGLNSSIQPSSSKLKTYKTKRNYMTNRSSMQRFLFRLSQQQSFNEDVNQLTHNKPVQKQSRLIQLTPSKDKDGIIHSNTRLANAPVSTATKNPIILDGINRIIRLFLGLQHNINGHVGVEQLTHSIHLNYWVLQCQTVMKKIDATNANDGDNPTASLRCQIFQVTDSQPNL